MEEDGRSLKKKISGFSAAAAAAAAPAMLLLS
jgi:hypothetical protein